jgi:hypothetical protein
VKETLRRSYPNTFDEDIHKAEAKAAGMGCANLVSQ